MAQTKKRSWKTTVAGMVAILAAGIWAVGEYLGIEAPPVQDLSGAVAAVAAGVGLLVGRDDKVSDEDAGAK